MAELLLYPAIIKPDDGGFLVTFRDFPEAGTWGADFPSALRWAQDCLACVLDGHMTRGGCVPGPSQAKSGEVMVAPHYHPELKDG